MATRARIGIQLKDDSVLSVYHHWDGYPEWLGKQLMEHYNTREKAVELIDGGDMSCCWTQDRWCETAFKMEESKEFGPQYYSQRGEDCPPRLDDSIFEYLDKDNNEEYAYIWTIHDKWVCYDMHSFDYRKQPEKVEIPAGKVKEGAI